MISKEHHKHAKLAKPKPGRFGRNEWAIYGAPCNDIQILASSVIQQLSQSFYCAYVDARHAAPEEKLELPGMLSSGARLDYTDAIQYQQLNVNAAWATHQYRQVFNECDAVLVNGNHHAAAAQVVIIKASKSESLKRRLEQLTNVRLIILENENTRVFDFLENALPDIHLIPKLLLQDRVGIIRFFEQEMQQNIPEINGLVLAGGKSQRMGQDKGTIEWHGKPQRDYLTDLLRPICKEVFISCRPEQEAEMKQAGHATIADTFLDLGPLGAILSAFRAQPDKAWLVIACDLPLLDRKTLDFLISERSVKHTATTFQSPWDHLPEPLISIWEPKAYAVLLSFLAQGFSCPRKVLINADAKILQVPDPETLQNVNTPEEMALMKQKLGS